MLVGALLMAISALGLVGSPAAAAVDRGGPCRPTVAVLGLNTPAAVRLLKSRGCTNVVVRNICMDFSAFGKVVYAWPVEGRIPAKKRVTLWRGVEGTGSDCILQYSFPGRFDGVYQIEPTVGSFTCVLAGVATTEAGSLFPAGGYFVVQDDQFTGGVLQGVIDDNGRADATLVTGNAQFPTMSGPIAFSLDSSGRLTVSGVMTGSFTASNGTTCTAVQELTALFQAEE
jgi:hypothetical protein